MPSGLIVFAIRNLARRRRRTAMALTAVAIGVAAMMTLRAFITGQQEVFLNGLVKGNVGALQVHHRGYVDTLERLPLSNDLADSAELRATLRSVPGVTAVAGRIVFGAMLVGPPPNGAHEGDSASATVMLTGIEPQAEREVCPQRFKWVGEGRVFQSTSSPQLWLNRELAKVACSNRRPARSCGSTASWPRAWASHCSQAMWRAMSGDGPRCWRRIATARSTAKR